MLINKTWWIVLFVINKTVKINQFEWTISKKYSTPLTLTNDIIHSKLFFILIILYMFNYCYLKLHYITNNLSI